jgi:hypothetical protein
MVGNPKVFFFPPNIWLYFWRNEHNNASIPPIIWVIFGGMSIKTPPFRQL